MSETISVADLKRDPAKADKLFREGIPLEFTAEEAMSFVARYKSADLRKGAFGELVAASQALQTEKGAVLPEELLLQLAGSLESDDKEYQTMAGPAMVVGGALVGGLVVGLAIAWYRSGKGTGSSNGKTKKTYTVKTKAGKVTINGDDGEPRGEGGDEGDSDDTVSSDQ